MKRRDVIKHLERAGCVFIREGRRHSWWGNSSDGRRSSVPRHTEIPDPLVKKICKDLGVAHPWGDPGDTTTDL